MRVDRKKGRHTLTQDPFADARRSAHAASLAAREHQLDDADDDAPPVGSPRLTPDAKQSRRGGVSGRGRGRGASQGRVGARRAL